MTFSALATNLANPSALVRYIDVSSTSPVVGNYFLWNTKTDLIGTSGTSVSSGEITLPQGYYWLIEAMIQSQYVGSSGGSTRIVEFEVYDVTNTTTIGSLATLNNSVWTGAEPNQLYSRDEASRCWVDTTTAARDIAVRITTITGLNFDSYSGGQSWAGQSRLFCWRFD
jgi:hypothetical protein